LRSFFMDMPVEVNRSLTDRISRWLFTPTEVAGTHLVREGFKDEQIVAVGDVMFDVALHHGARVNEQGGLLGKLDLKPGQYVLATIHRAENTDHPKRLAAVVDALRATAKTVPVVWPLHPRTRAVLQQAGQLDALSSEVMLIDPVGYIDMVQLEKYAALIATDSGGVQKEAFFYQVPCVTLRDETEWVELVEAGWNRLASPENATELAQTIASALGSVGRDVKPYGDGDAAKRIVERLASDLHP
ncbi:MAG: UDP-N-acetylglucosamine 2-epimerase, partial [Brachymonas sp.]|nr:UDP-N-acetylglucosamine 2-epimerase [Brachymonas sp.]